MYLPSIKKRELMAEVLNLSHQNIKGVIYATTQHFK